MIEEPWTATISRDDMPEVVKLVPRWSQKTVVSTRDELYFNPARRFYPYKFLPDPGGKFLPKGFGWLLKKVQGNADDLLAYITDIVKTAADNGGVIGGDGNVVGQSYELQPNRINVIPTGGAPIGANAAMFQPKDVSPGMVQVLEKMMTLGDRLAGTLNSLENAPASMTATLAKGLIDNGTQVQSAVHRRLVGSMTDEVRAFVSMADAYDQLPAGMSAALAGGIGLTADPQLATEMHRSALAGIYMEMLQDPLVNPMEVRLRLYRTLRLPQPEKLLGTPPNPQATPKEKGDIAVAMEKVKNDRIKTIGQFILWMAQAKQALTEANAGQIDARMALLQMAQLEQAVQHMLLDNQNANAATGNNGMAGAAGNTGADPTLPPSSADGGDAVPQQFGSDQPMPAGPSAGV